MPNVLLNNDELVELMILLNFSLEESASTISDLRLTLKEEQELVNKLNLTLEEQNQLLELLKSYKSTPSYIHLWEDYRTIIIIFGALIFLLIIGGGRRK